MVSNVGRTGLRRKLGKNVLLPRPQREEQHFGNNDGTHFAVLLDLLQDV